ncbi:hypothetical protein [Clostridium sp.]|uniref:hypothetical protein n=1 Tax=Clostridium sp. TaxID=1506 RepID=UPI002847B0DD|nr:hypothetical protein [Clostridium sp.]MDR3597053.1 hypothetical protein [Clostridium sp.]
MNNFSETTTTPSAVFWDSVTMGSSLNIVKDIIIPILLSVVAGIIFWLIFNYFPDKNRKSKIRPKIEFNMFTIYKELIYYLDYILAYNINTSTFFQFQLKGGILEKEDFELGLQNKCANNTYLYDENHSKFIVIGNLLVDRASKINNEIERIFLFNQFLSVDEILLLEKIREKLSVYEFKANAQSPYGSPINPNLSYMTDGIFTIYKLFLQLQRIIFSNKYFKDSSIVVDIIRYYYCNKNYKLCQDFIKKNINKYVEHKITFDCFDLLCDYELNKKEVAFKKLDKLFKDKIELVGFREMLSPMIKENRFTEILNESFTEKETEYFYKVVLNDEITKQSYINQNKELKKYYEEKETNFIMSKQKQVES